MNIREIYETCCNVDFYAKVSSFRTPSDMMYGINETKLGTYFSLEQKNNPVIDQEVWRFVAVAGDLRVVLTKDLSTK